MRNLFYYTRKIGDKTFEDALNVDLIIRTFQNEQMNVVLLDDGHEEARDVPVLGAKHGEQKRERQWFQSEIHLSLEDYNRLKEYYGNFDRPEAKMRIDSAVAEKATLEKIQDATV